MYNFVLPLLMGMSPAGGEAAGPASLITSLIPFAAIILIFYFLIIRPQNKKRKETDAMQTGLKKGDKVVTIGGIHGTIQSTKPNTIIVRVDDNVKLEFLRSAISHVVTPGKEEKIEDKTESDGQDSESGE